MRAGELLDTIVQYIKKLPLFDKGMQTIDNRIMAPILLAISLRNLRVNKTRTILSVLGIIIGIFAICTLGMSGALFTETIDEIIEKNADIIMAVAVSEDETNPQYNFMAYLPMLSENDVSRIDKAVMAVTPDYSLTPYRRTVQQISVSQNADVSGMLMFGEKDKLEVVLGTRLIEGHLPRMNTDILVIKSFADNYNLRIGNHLKITANDGTEVRLKITGIVEDSLLATVYSIIQSPNIVLLPDELYDMLYSDTQKYSDSVSSAESKSYPFVMIRVADTTLREPVIQAIDREMNGKYRTTNDDRVLTQDLMAFASDLQNILSMTVLLGLAVSAISLIIASVSIANIMIISVQERKPEIGLMRVIGTTRRQITLMFLFESGLIGLFGSLAGVVISVILISLPLLLILHDVSYLLLPSVWIYIPLGVAVGILVCVISGLYPAIKAARLNPVEAIG